MAKDNKLRVEKLKAPVLKRNLQNISLQFSNHPAFSHNLPDNCRHKEPQKQV